MATPSDKNDMQNPEEAETEQVKGRDAAYWAKGVSKLTVSEVPEGALNLNVEGRRVVGPIQGFGRMWQKTYRIRLASADVTPAEVVKTWKENFSTFWPEKNFFYGPLTGIAPGEVAVLNLSMPGRLKLSTGVFVLYADDESFTFMTPEGHMLAGWITFSAFKEDRETVAQAQVLIRAQDPMSELGLTLGGHKQEDRFWEHTLRSLAAHFGVDGEVETQVVCVDRKRQWRRAGNIRHSAAIRSGMYAAGAPLRLLKSPRRVGATRDMNAD